MSAVSRGGTARRRAARRPHSERVGREGVDEIQRLRIVAAMAEVVCERGLERTTVSHIVGRAGISRRTFYDLFEDRQACFRALFEEAVTQGRSRVLVAWRGERRWVDRVRSALWALLTWIDEEPELAGACFIHALGAGPELLLRRAALLRETAGAIDGGREEVRGDGPAPLTAEGVVGAVSSVIHARLLAASAAHTTDPGNALTREHTVGAAVSTQRGSTPIAALLAPLMTLVVQPYLGPAAAKRELSRPLPEASPAVGGQVGTGRSKDPLQGLDMRLTYRTVRVLAVLAAEPGGSNRDIAERAGISDQGQISKLLTRLDSRGLIENIGEGHARGAPNAWRLTLRGAEVQRALQLEGGPTAR